MRPIDILDQATETAPDRLLLVSDSEAWTYAEAHLRTRLSAGRLAADGFEAGAHAAVLSPNCADAVLFALGAMRAGLVWLPMNPRHSDVTNAGLLKHLDCDILFVHSSLAEGIRDAMTRADVRVRQVVAFDTEADSWLGGISPDQAPTVDAAPDDVAAICATSGTTGEPKGVMLTNHNFDAFSRTYQQMLGTTTPPVCLAAAPLTHVAGRICFPIIAQGGTIVVLPRPEPGLVIEAIEKHRVTELFLPPTAIGSLLEHPALATADLSSLRYLSYGAAPMRVEMLKQALATFGPVMVQGYGQTEAPMMIAMMRPEDHYVGGRIAPDERLRSCGRATPAVEIRILSGEGESVPTGEVGHVCVRGEIVMKGYYKDPDATAQASRFGWHHTGDLGYLDEDGYLYLVDRAKDMIITGGFNVYPAEVEHTLALHPAVEEVVVIGVPDDKWGEAVTALVKLNDDTVTDEELVAFAKKELGSVKAPKRIERWNQFPRSDTGKLQKKAIRDQFWSGQARRI
jgi:acyl-CoA synthetase (AMP-forming)/AMP-acid ligase II